MPTVRVRVDAKDMISGLEAMQRAIQIANAAAAARIREGIMDIILGSYNIALEEAGEGFPTTYANHLRRGIRSLQPEVTATEDGVVAQYFEIEGLGTLQDLEEGYHYHALLEIDKKNFSVSSPRISQLPYTGADLYNDFSKRYGFWQALVDGDDYTVTLGPKKKPTHEKVISTEGLYEQTLRARVTWWGDRYPEWTILEYGTEYYPSVPPTHFAALTEQRVYEYMSSVYDAVLEAVIAAWEQPNVTTNSVGQLVNEKGRFVKYLPDDLRGR